MRAARLLLRLLLLHHIGASQLLSVLALLLLTRCASRRIAAPQYSLLTAFHAMRSFCNKDKVALEGLGHYFAKEMDRQMGCILLWSDYQARCYCY